MDTFQTTYVQLSRLHYPMCRTGSRPLLIYLLLSLWLVALWPPAVVHAQSAITDTTSTTTESDTDTSEGRGTSLANLLNSDGTLHLPSEGILGSINPAGYQLVSTEDEAPRFAYTLTTEDADANWDPRFQLAGMNDIIHALAWDGNYLYAGGNFTHAGGTTANGIARWDGSQWDALGSGMNNTVYTLFWGGTYLYAGGAFTSAGGTAANYIARWDGNSWSALVSGTNGTVYALTGAGTNIYVGGGFTTAGGITVNYIARWDAIQNGWYSLGNGMNGPVVALAGGGSHLYAGGGFTTAGGRFVNHIAEWTGGNWYPLGAGLPNFVYGMIEGGGYILTVGGAFANGVARWDGVSWSTPGGGVNGVVRAVALDSNNQLYVGGDFSTSSGVQVNHIAKWNGVAWSALGSGTSGLSSSVRALVADSSNALYVGGDFTTAGDKASAYIARWAEPQNVTAQIGKVRTSVVWTPTSPPGFGGTIGYYSLAFNFTNNTNNPKQTLHAVYYEVVAATKAYLLNPTDGTPGDIGEQILVIDSALPGGDTLWQFGESLTNQQYQVGVTGSGWKLTLAIYAVDNGQRSKAQWLDIIELSSEDFPLVNQTIFLPLLQR